MFRRHTGVAWWTHSSALHILLPRPCMTSGPCRLDTFRKRKVCTTLKHSCRCTLQLRIEIARWIHSSSQKILLSQACTMSGLCHLDIFQPHNVCNRLRPSCCCTFRRHIVVATQIHSPSQHILLAQACMKSGPRCLGTFRQHKVCMKWRHSCRCTFRGRTAIASWICCVLQSIQIRLPCTTTVRPHPDIFQQHNVYNSLQRSCRWA